MDVAVNGTRLWFDVEGAGLVADGPVMRGRPTMVLVHGGPATYDHSYFKPQFSTLARTAQVVYLDLREHGRSARHDPAAWSFEHAPTTSGASATRSASSDRSSSGIRWAA